jgi:DNA-binding transcriptional ArsR family regulator
MNQAAMTAALLKSCDLVSQVMRSLSHPVRLKILCQLLEGEKTVNELVEFCQISQSAMSQFLGRMKDEGLIVSRREGHFMYYRVEDAKLVRLLRSVKEIYC